MDYVMLKDVCTINMGQSPDSNSYNDNGDGVPFFQGNADFDTQSQESGVLLQQKWLLQMIFLFLSEHLLGR